MIGISFLDCSELNFFFLSVIVVLYYFRFYCWNESRYPTKYNEVSGWKLHFSNYSRHAIRYTTDVFFFPQSSENHKGQPMFNSNLAFITLLLTIFFLFNLWSQKCIIFFLEYSVITNILMCSYFPALQDSNTMSLSKGQNIYICTASVSINGRKLFCLMGDKV